MIERVLVLSALACAGVNAFGYLPDFVTSCSDYWDESTCTMTIDGCAWNGASCETDECSYYHDQASCPSWSYGSQCFWTWGVSATDKDDDTFPIINEGCTSNDPCSGLDDIWDDDELSCIYAMDQCTWNGASCETDECSYYHDQASCPSWSYGSQCFWTGYATSSGTEVCRSIDPCSASYEP